MKATGINPFEDDIVTEPRCIEGTNDALNREAFEEVNAAFTRLRKQVPPRLDKVPSAMLITSPEPGYGKSHLIGRLFRRLDDDATLIYLRPYQDRETCWRNILDKVVSELDYPDRPDAIACRPGELTQLGALAYHVLAHLIASSIEHGILDSSPDSKEETIKALRERPVEVMQSKSYKEWIQDNFDVLLEGLENELQRKGVQLSLNPQAWLKVLFYYVRGKSAIGKICLAWIKSHPLEDDERKEIKLGAADNPDSDLPFGERNEICFKRIQDLCLLSSFYRPFLFCFDQTELYGTSAELAKSFGVVISRLRREAKNHLTLVTANYKPWEHSIQRHFEEADRQALHPQPTRLKGVRKLEALEIVRNRLSRNDTKDAQIAEFLERPFFDALFASTAERSIREVLRECSRAWSKPAPVDLEKIFASYRLKVTASPKGLDFDAGVLQWAFTHLLPLATDFKPCTFRSAKGYLTLKWESDTQVYLFSFEEGGNFMRWKAILNEAERYHKQSKGSARTLFFRLPSQSPFGGKLAEKIKDASEYAGCVRISRDGAVELYAAHDLYADTCQGDHPELSEEAVLRFLSSYFMPRLKHFVEVRKIPSKEDQKAAEHREDLAEAIRGVMQHVDLVPWSTLQKRLQKKELSPSLPETVAACALLASEIRVLSTPSNAVFRWIK
jgi:hypothetical protein